MPPKACDYYSWPTRDETIIVGDSVGAVLQIQNCGTEDGYFYYLIQKDGVTCVSQYNKFIKYSGYNVSDLANCDFIMPNATVAITFIAGHAEYPGGVGTWVEDFKKTYKFLPEIVTKTCNQKVRARDQYGTGIIGVAAKAEGDKVITCTTNTYGECTLSNLTEGIVYKITATHPNYISSPVYSWVPACILDVVNFTLIPKCSPEGAEKCVGFDLYRCISGKWELITKNSPKCGYECDPAILLEKCVGYDLYRCISNKWELVEPNSTKCGYIPEECTPTGHASDAKIDHANVPGTAVKGGNVTGSVSVDCIEVGETRYRVKFTLDGIVTYSDSFLLGYIGEMDVPFSFTMPANDVTLIAEIERCNKAGKWEPCTHPDHKKTYTIKVVEEVGIGRIEDVKCNAVEQWLFGGYEVTATVTVENNDTKKHEYKVKMIDPINDKKLDTEPTTWRNVNPGDTSDIKLTTEMKPTKATSTTLLFELWECTAIFPLPCKEQLADSMEIDCEEVPKPPFEIPKTLIIYGIATVGMYAVGSFIPGKAGKGIKIAAIIPGALTAYEGYKIVKEKIPFI